MTPSEECQSHLRELREWLRIHPPKPYWTDDQHRARRDRERELTRWVEVATRLNKDSVQK